MPELTEAQKEEKRIADEAAALKRTTGTASNTKIPTQKRKVFQMSKLDNFKFGEESNKVATPAQIESIGTDLKESGVPESDIDMVMIDIVAHCLDVDSSAQTHLVGFSEYSPEKTRDSIASVIKKHCTLRQFCLYFAKIIWNKMKKENRPPGNWQSKGLTYENRFAGFDFFSGVEHESALEPDEGLLYPPTAAERTANQTLKMVAIHRVASKEGNATLHLGEVTGGRFGAKATLGLSGNFNDF